MSKESSIKVFAENFSGSDKPVNAISVWLENASDIPGGGGSIPSTVSGKWEDASDCVQTNSGTWGQGGGSIPSSFSANNITANSGLVVGNIQNGEWGYEGGGALFDTNDASIKICSPIRPAGANEGYISLTSKSGFLSTTATASCDINAFDWNKLMELYNVVSTNSANW